MQQTIQILPVTLDNWVTNIPLPEQLLPKITALEDALVQIGDNSYQTLQNDKNLSDKALFNHYRINYEWSESVKSFLVLCRNVLFESKKGEILLADNNITAELLSTHREESITIIRSAFEEIKAAIEEQPIVEDKLKKWHLQTNPWPIYKTQFKALTQQHYDIIENKSSLLGMQVQFKHIENLVHQNIDDVLLEVDYLRKVLHSVLDFIEDMMSNEEALQNIRLKVEQATNVINPSILHQLFKPTLEQHLNQLPEQLKIIVGVEGGMLVRNEFPLKKRTTQWLNTEISPILYEVWEILDNTITGADITLVNVQNQLILLEQQEEEGNTLENLNVGLAIQLFLKKITQAEETIKEQHVILIDRLSDHFKTSLIYTDWRNFLPIPLENAIQPLRATQGKIQQFFKQWLNNQANLLTDFQASVKQEEKLSISEKIVRYIKAQTKHEDNSYYTNIFLTKGQIGETFWVGRENDIQRITKIVNDWSLGYRGAALLTGDRLSGKSLFGELITNRFFSNNVIHLKPTDCIIQGEHFNPNHNLKEAFRRIEQHEYQERPLIWIDDFELWSDSTSSIGQNIQRLRNFMDSNISSFFFLVSMSSWLKNHLQRFYNIDRSFQAEIKLSPMSLEEVNDAILIRHNATHKVLINKKEEDIKPQQFKRITKQIYKATKGNIGEVLNTWATSTQTIDDVRVKNGFESNFTFPNFLNAEIGTLLATIVLQKQSNTRKLRQAFGPVYSKKYAGIVKRLIGVGILKQNIAKQITLNEVVANKVAHLLVKEGYLA